MTGPVKKIVEDKWPRDVRETVNELVDFANRPLTVKFSLNAGVASVNVADNTIDIVLPVQAKTDCDGNTFYVVAVNSI